MGRDKIRSGNRIHLQLSLYKLFALYIWMSVLSCHPKMNKLLDTFICLSAYFNPFNYPLCSYPLLQLSLVPLSLAVHGKASPSLCAAISSAAIPRVGGSSKAILGAVMLVQLSIVELSAILAFPSVAIPSIAIPSIAIPCTAIPSAAIRY